MWAYALLAGSQLIGGYQQADAIKGSADVQQSINDMNAKYEEQDAFNAQKSGYSQADRYSTVVDSTIAKQRTNEAAAGQAVGYGTAGAVEGDSKLTGMVNVMQIQRQAREQAHGFQVQAINTQLGGAMQEQQAQMDASAAINKGFTGALSTGVSGYERSNVSGVGQNKNTGDSNSPTWRAPGASYTNPNAAGGYGSQPAWFFGSSPSKYSQPSSSSLFSDSDWKF